ncbi:MAG: MBL fold metallo-hydrolase [Gemmatimonadetes bacterium]|nr:MBL fold metallo-hydrolase [Gemmatimonadota bacterium]
MAPLHARPRARRDEMLITAVGHSTFLIQVGALNILTDPVWGERASPLAFAGPRRRHAPGLAFDALPPIDLVLLSHDHYDHLDDATVRALARQHPGATWCAPVGVGARLRSRGVRTVIERDWWQVASLGPALGDARVTCLPAAHFSGRTPFDRDRTLWCGWAIEIAGRRIYFVGDTGLHPEFEAIGRHLGALDAVLMPIGAYEPRWFMRPVHLDPDEALAAFGSLTASHGAHATVMVAMHWGTFVLTDESPDEPPRRIAEAWERERRPAERLWVLAPGETRSLSSAP